MAKSSESSIVTKCAKLMDVLSQARQPLAFSDVIDQTGFVKSSCHRILAVLQTENLVDYDPTTRTYSTGPRLHQWARSAWRRTDLQHAAAKVMNTLSDEAEMNVALSVLDENTILYLRTVDFIPLRYAAHSGDHAPLHCTAAGKVFLSYMTPAKCKKRLTEMPLEKYTEHTKTTPAALEAEFTNIRSNGFARADEEETLRVVGLAAPIRNADGDVTAALSLWANTDGNGDHALEITAQKVMAAANEISKRLGWSES